MSGGGGGEPTGNGGGGNEPNGEGGSEQGGGRSGSSTSGGGGLGASQPAGNAGEPNSGGAAGTPTGGGGGEESSPGERDAGPVGQLTVVIEGADFEGASAEIFIYPDLDTPLATAMVADQLVEFANAPTRGLLLVILTHPEMTTTSGAALKMHALFDAAESRELTVSPLSELVVQRLRFALAQRAGALSDATLRAELDRLARRLFALDIDGNGDINGVDLARWSLERLDALVATTAYEAAAQSYLAGENIILDVLALTGPQVLDIPSTAEVVAIDIQDSELAMAEGDFGVELVDLSVPLRPSAPQLLESPGVALDVAFGSEALYVAAGDAGLVQLLREDWQPRSLSVGATVTEVATGPSHVAFIDASPAVHVVAEDLDEANLATWLAAAPIFGLAQAPGFVFVAQSDRLVVLSHSESTLELVHTIDWDSTGPDFSAELLVDGNRLYALRTTWMLVSGLYRTQLASFFDVVDISEPRAATLLSSEIHSGLSVGSLAKGDTNILARIGDSFVEYAPNTSGVSEVARFDGTSNSVGLRAAEGYWFNAVSNQGTTIIDTTPDRAVVERLLRPGTVRRSAVTGSLILSAADRGGFQSARLEAGSLRSLDAVLGEFNNGTFATTTPAHFLAIDDQRAFVMEGSNPFPFSTLRHYSFQQPASLALRGTYEGQTLSDVALLDENHVLLADATLQVLEILSDGGFSPVAELPLAASDVASTGRVGFLNVDGALMVTDLSDPSNPQAASNVEQQPDSAATRVFLSNGELVVLTATTLHLYDVTEPSLPALSATYEIVGSTSAHVTDSLIYVGDAKGRLLVIDRATSELVAGIETSDVIYDLDALGTDLIVSGDAGLLRIPLLSAVPL